MKIHELIITRNFLLHLKNQHQNEQFMSATDVFLNLLSREELLHIIDTMTGGTQHEEDPVFEESTNKELLSFIDDQYYILEYLISRIEREIGI